MRALAIILSFALFILVKQYSAQSHHSPAEAHVLQTAVYSVAGAVIVNAVCAVAAPHLDPEIRASDAFTSCLPFGVGAAAVVGKTHIFVTGSWQPEHWRAVTTFRRRFNDECRKGIELVSGKLGFGSGSGPEAKAREL